MKPKFSLTIKQLGQIPYQQALEMMLDLREQRLQDQIDDHLLFLEHPAVVTSGRRPSEDDLKLPVELLKQKGVDYIKTDRGGRLTYHGPGQLVVYFIINIDKRKLSIDQLVCQAEEGLLQFLNHYGLTANRDKRNPGIWIGNSKIASLGFHVHRGITTHGISLNIDMDMKPFSYILPCGVPDAGVTSMADHMESVITMDQAREKLSQIYSDIFSLSEKQCQNSR